MYNKEAKQKLARQDAITETYRNKPVTRAAKKIGRNAPCPCGSGKKYKNCHSEWLNDVQYKI